MLSRIKVTTKNILDASSCLPVYVNFKLIPIVYADINAQSSRFHQLDIYLLNLFLKTETIACKKKSLRQNEINIPWL